MAASFGFLVQLCAGDDRFCETKALTLGSGPPEMRIWGGLGLCSFVHRVREMPVGWAPCLDAEESAEKTGRIALSVAGTWRSFAVSGFPPLVWDVMDVAVLWFSCAALCRNLRFCETKPSCRPVFVKLPNSLMAPSNSIVDAGIASSNLRLTGGLPERVVKLLILIAECVVTTSCLR